MTDKLTPKMQAALDEIKANGKVGYWLNALKERGINAHSVQGLKRRGLVLQEGSYYVLAPEKERSECGAEPCCGRYKTEEGCIFK